MAHLALKALTAATVAAVLCVVVPAWADDGGTDSASDAGVPDASGDAPGALLVPPVILEQPVILPPAAPVAPVEVETLLTIDPRGAVSDATIVRSGGAAFDGAVLAGVRRFRFAPARQGGKAIAVRIPFTQRFEPAPPPAPAVALEATLEGTVVSRGTRTPVVGATVFARDPGGGRQMTVTAANGTFTLPVPAGPPLEVEIAAPEHDRFLQRERLERGQRLRVRYLIDRRSFGVYESYVRAEADRTEVSRTTLSGRELTRVAGTFGDPFRVIGLMPGVTSTMSLLPMPIVRGSSPGNTGIMLDGIRLPLLFHLLAGPSVVHPEFVDHVDFYPGGFPVRYGGYTGGIVDGVTRAARPGERHVELDLNLTQTGLFVREPLPKYGLTVTGAARIGYPGVVLSLLSPDGSLSYWDYQLRVDSTRGAHQYTVFVFGAADTLGARPSPSEEIRDVAHFGFHRFDLRYRHGDDRAGELVRLTVGYDKSEISDDEGSSTTPTVRQPGAPGAPSAPQTEVGASVNDVLGNGTWSFTPELGLHRRLHASLLLNTGATSIIRRIDRPPLPAGQSIDPNLFRVVNENGIYTSSALWLELVWQPTERLRFIPGVRGDLYDERRASKAVTKSNIDPRLALRYRIGETLTLKGAAGRYHQPPRIFLPVPGIDASSLELGLLASSQLTIGAEARLGPGAELDANVYYNDMNPILFDLDINTPAPGRSNDDVTLESLFARRTGRSYGLELLLRKRDTERFFGWLAYTLSRSERDFTGGTAPFDFDRTHIVNLVAGLRLPRNWEIGVRVLYQTGTPINTVVRNRGRSEDQHRIDLRIDKRAVWNRWLLDFYVDIINATVAEESGGLVGNEAFRYLIPTVGFRAVL